MSQKFSVFASDIPTRQTQGSKPPSKSTRQPCVFEMPPVLLAGPFFPDSDFQSNGLAVPRVVPKAVGLGLDFIEPGISRQSLPQSKPSTSQKRRTAQTRTSSSFECTGSTTRTTIDENSIPSAMLLSDDEAFNSKFNSLRDLDVQYPSSRSLNSLSPALNYSYSSPALSPSWSLDSILTATALAISEDISPSSSGGFLPSPAPWSSSPLPIPLSVKEVTDSHPFLVAQVPNMALPSAELDSNMFCIATSDAGVNPTHVMAPLDSVPFNFENVFITTMHGESDSNSSTKSLMLDPHHPPKFNHFDSRGFIKSVMFVPPRSPQNPHGSFHDHTLSPVPKTGQNLSSSLAVGTRVVKRKSSAQQVSYANPPTPSIVPGSPVLDAHRGISQADLEARARRYQERNPGVEDFDRSWLSAFLGKLSAEGEMIPNFRCYVAGCTQVNKRRDHMIVHVGSHLDQRLFKCERCPSRFRRKNELKRHEQTHTTSRPFTCAHCGTMSFKRQDLLGRHIRNKHNLELEKSKENARPSKKVKME